MYYLIKSATITVCPGEAHEITSDEAFTWHFFNCGPGRMLVDKTLLPKGDITVVSGSGPITLFAPTTKKLS